MTQREAVFRIEAPESGWSISPRIKMEKVIHKMPKSLHLLLASSAQAKTPKGPGLFYLENGGWGKTLSL